MGISGCVWDDRSDCENNRQNLKVAELSREDNLQLIKGSPHMVGALGALHDKGLVPDEALVDRA